MAKLTPYIFSENARAQAEFYTEALGGEIVSIMTFADAPNTDEQLKDKVMHMSFIAGGILFYMSDSPFQKFHRGNGMHLSLEYGDEAEAYERFDKLAAGGKVLDALKPQFWGSLFGLIEDKYGVLWQVTTEAQNAE
jgi:PhnB protein